MGKESEAHEIKDIGLSYIVGLILTLLGWKPLRVVEPAKSACKLAPKLPPKLL